MEWLRDPRSSRRLASPFSPPKVFLGMLETARGSQVSAIFAVMLKISTLVSSSRAPSAFQDWRLGGVCSWTFVFPLRTQLQDSETVVAEMQGLGCIGRVMRDRKQDARAPVAQSVSARYLYGSMCAGDAEVVSSILTWSTVLPASLRRFPLSFPSLMCLNLSYRVYSYLPLSNVLTKQRLCCVAVG